MKTLNEAEIFVSQSLRVGVLVSAVVILAGLILFLSSGQSGYPGETYPTTLKDILAGTWSLKPFAMILSGLVLLILTPVMRVGVSILVFLKEKDWLYVWISSAVFLILVCSFLFGK
ncbi:DUF1634 domain-containing protein [Pelosinus sp. sgz500959]|uniref:DUF1634 domain-containing protein n=1 Tax=Pelosinus sp. sgz500959 TaxID=3242472 RepID=UPI003671FDCB